MSRTTDLGIIFVYNSESFECTTVKTLVCPNKEESFTGDLRNKKVR